MKSTEKTDQIPKTEKQTTTLHKIIKRTHTYKKEKSKCSSTKPPRLQQLTFKIVNYPTNFFIVFTKTCCIMCLQFAGVK